MINPRFLPNNFLNNKIEPKPKTIKPKIPAINTMFSLLVIKLTKSDCFKINQKLKTVKPIPANRRSINFFLSNAIIIFFIYMLLLLYFHQLTNLLHYQ